MKNIVILVIFIFFSNIYAQNEIDCDKFLEVLNENRILAKKGNSIGVIDTLGNVIIDFKYEQIEYYNNGNYYTLGNKTLLAKELSSGKEVLLNLKTGKNILENFKNAKVRDIKNDYTIIGITTNLFDKKRLYINSNGKILFEIQKISNSTFHKPSYLSENSICILTNPREVNTFTEHKSRYIYVDTLGIKKFNKSYISSGDFSNQRAINAEYKNGKLYYGFIDDKGNQRIKPIYSKRPTDFSNNVSRVKSKNNKYGYIDKEGNLIIQPKYSRASGFYKGFALVKDNYDGIWKVIDKTGKVVKEFTNLKRIHSAMSSDFSNKKIKSIKQIIEEGLFKVTFNLKNRIYQKAIIDFDENVLINFKSLKIKEYKYGLTISSKYDKMKNTTIYKVINKNNKVILINKTNQF